MTARGQATRIRLQALREAAELSTRAAALSSQPRAQKRVLDALERAIDRVGGAWERDGGEDGSADRLRELSARAEARVGAAEPAAIEPTGRFSRGTGPPDGEGEQGEDEQPGPGPRRVSVDVGPFSDFSQLVRFEDAANSIGGAGEISIRRFAGGRASIDVALTDEIDLLRELEERCDLEFRVRHNGEDEIVLDVGE